MAVFGASSVFTTSGAFPSFPTLPAALEPVILNSFLTTSGIVLLLIAFSNQLLLKFYVGKSALTLATVMTSLGTLLIYGTSLDGSTGWAFAFLAGIIMAIGSSLMTVLWGTAFSRHEFTTIILNTTIAMVIGVVMYLVLTHWVPSPFSGIIAATLPVIASLLLWGFTPIPYYRRQEIPIFHPLPIHRLSFAVRFGIPTLIFGFSIGAIRQICVSGILPINDVTSQLVIGAAACVGVGAILATVTLSKNESHWDVIFRCLVPVIAVALLFMPQLTSDYIQVASFFMVCGYICFETLMWVFFGDIAQEFRLSPIFVFGLGRGLMEIGTIVGAGLAGFPASTNILMLGTSGSALILLFSLVVAYVLLPREREIRAIVDPNHIIATPGYHALKTQLDENERKAEIAEAGDDGVAEIDEKSRAKGRFHARCEGIADRYMLSRRETEVMFLLAKGHNAAFIQDKLCISKSTAKTHINHIYRKLDIHTQQELLNMVEDHPEEDPAEKEPLRTAAGKAARAKISGVRSDIFKPRK